MIISDSGYYQRADKVPYKGDPNYPLDPSLPLSAKPQLAVEAVTRIFDLSDAGDLREYSLLMQEEAFGHLMVRREERQAIPEKQNWKVFLVAWRFVEELPRDTVARKKALYDPVVRKAVAY